MRVVRIHQQGGPEAMRLEDLPTPEPAAGQVRVRVVAAGVNFIDIYDGGGQYSVPLPFALGREGAGTVEALARGSPSSTFPLEPGHRCVIHAAAGGVGQLFCQMARMRGAALVIGTAGSEQKAKLAREAGAHEVILYREKDFLAEVKRIRGWWRAARRRCPY
jgi:NADPH:quinone reductase